MTRDAPSIYWLRQDLRIADNPALIAAARNGPVAALYVFDDTLPHTPGAASRVWLHHSLASLTRELAAYGVPLFLRRGAASEIVTALAAKLQAAAVFWNRVYEPAAIARDSAIKAELSARGIVVNSFAAALLHEPWTIKNKEGRAFRVFTPFAKACLAAGSPPPLARPSSLTGARTQLRTGTVEDLRLLPKRDRWAGALAARWQVGEAAAAARLTEFLANAFPGYAASRDFPGIDATSRLSPHLHFGEIGPRQVAAAINLAADTAGTPQAATARDKFISELLWREFAHHLLFAFPALPDEPLDARFSAFPWREDERLFEAWTRGATGIPIVDAGMRQLWQTGWMHNRVRMIVASFLVKNLLQPWQRGAAWFWDTLADADLANNSASWQWVAGCGADAAPYFRVFNPVLQGRKFDADGAYVRHYVPELARLPERVIHAPWEASGEVLGAAGVQLGKTYPHAIVGLKPSRDRALAAFATLKTAG